MVWPFIRQIELGIDDRAFAFYVRESLSFLTVDLNTLIPPSWRSRRIPQLEASRRAINPPLALGKITLSLGFRIILIIAGRIILI